MNKRVALFMDGTWLSDESKVKSNVWALYDGVRPRARSDNKEQLRQYQKGIGASGPWLWRIAAGGAGIGLESNYMEMYEYLVQHYQTGDEIYLFGFSRGAYTARCLAGVIRKCGVLKPEFSGDPSILLTVWRLYVGGDHPDSEKAKQFRRRYCLPEFIEPDNFIIHFIGIFDTVGTLGVPGRVNEALMRLHDTKLSRYVHHAYHALAIDEHRKFFEACLWTLPEHPLPGQQVIQTWFPGSHCDVGGSYPQHGLADCSLAWMADKAISCGLDIDYLMFPNFKPRPAGTLHNSNTVLYRMLHPRLYHRPIDKPVRKEQVSEFARERTELVDNYAPKYLMEYIDRKSPPPIYTPLPALATPPAPRAPKGRFARVASFLKGLTGTVEPPEDLTDDKYDPRPVAGPATEWNGHEFVEMAVHSKQLLQILLDFSRGAGGNWIGYLLLVPALMLVGWATVDTDITSLNALVALDGAVLGWVIGILLSPIGPKEHSQFRGILTVISTFVTGYVLARLDLVVGTNPGSTMTPIVVRGLFLFAGGLLLGALATFIWRHGREQS